MDKTNKSNNGNSKAMKFNTRKDSVDKSRATPTHMKSIISNVQHSSISRNENILKINDDNDDTLDLGRDLSATMTADFGLNFGHSRGFSLRTTPKTTIAPVSEEMARVKRAYSKYSSNL